MYTKLGRKGHISGNTYQFVLLTANDELQVLLNNSTLYKFVLDRNNHTQMVSTKDGWLHHDAKLVAHINRMADRRLDAIDS